MTVPRERGGTLRGHSRALPGTPGHSRVLRGHFRAPAYAPAAPVYGSVSALPADGAGAFPG
ncbi:hypothetical protein DDQ41_26505 [Streptomyces spongiicola]|uniref:Uncharacterized protein n=1 Tax=Streptomyces spongiicola TaxID=1690221 RepID=A0ABN5KR77_9ACTN|nr:hypothetical protein DDQ41_26505 [Streptomyces spongiicola]